MGLACDVTTPGDLRRRRGSRPPSSSATRARGMKVALSALDAGRLGIAAVATGIAQAALDARGRRTPASAQQFGRPIGELQGLQFLLADMAADVERARATYLLRGAAARTPAGPFGRQASDREADRLRRGDAGDDRRRPGARRQRLHPGVPRRAALPRRQGHPDLRGHQPDPADGDRARPARADSRRPASGRRRRDSPRRPRGYGGARRR